MKLKWTQHGSSDKAQCGMLNFETGGDDLYIWVAKGQNVLSLRSADPKNSAQAIIDSVVTAQEGDLRDE